MCIICNFALLGPPGPFPAVAVNIVVYTTGPYKMHLRACKVP